MNIVEIGAGSRPALREPGSALLHPEVEYHAVDVCRPEVDERDWPDEESRTRFLASLAITEGVKLPFPDQSVDHIIMKNFFGQFTNQEDTDSTFENAVASLYEAFRVLKYGGRLAIAEENTPERPGTVGNVITALLGAGFDGIKVYPCQSMENPNWRAERTKYWDISEKNLKWSPLETWGHIAYLVRATRPEVETEAVELNVCNPDGEFETDVFQRSVKRAPRAPRDPAHLYEEYRPITVVTKDADLNLATYFEMVRSRELEPLFRN